MEWLNQGRSKKNLANLKKSKENYNFRITETDWFRADLCRLPIEDSAFRGTCLALLLLFYRFDACLLVVLLLTDGLYKSKYVKMWDRETLKLTDDIYSLLRTLYR